jgi:hypothetical protein
MTGAPARKRDSRNDSYNQREPGIIRAATQLGQQQNVTTCNGSYRMIESIEIENFRGFKNLQLSGLRTVNVMVGRSASGKTALLEAIRLSLGATPTVAWTMTAQRGVPIAVQFNPPRENFEAMWSSLFYNFDISQRIKLRAKSSDSRSASVDIFFDKNKPVTPIPQTQFGVQPLTSTIIPLAFERVSFDTEDSVLLATILQQQHGQLNLEQGPELGISSEFFPSTWQSNAQQIAGWFSQLSISNRSLDIVKTVREHFGEILDISTESPYGVSSLYATLKHMAHKIPISLVSSGINKFIGLLIAIRTYKNGVILIDEVENGVWFKILSTFWHALHEFAVENNTQLFLSTHSLECLQAATKTIDSYPDDFALLQLAQEEGLSTARVAAGADASAAIESDIELRK